MARRKEKYIKIAGERLLIARKIYGWNLEDISDNDEWRNTVDVCDVKRLGEWERDGIPENRIASVAKFFKVPQYYFTDSRITLDDFRHGIEARKEDENAEIKEIILTEEKEKTLADDDSEQLEKKLTQVIRKEFEDQRKLPPLQDIPSRPGIPYRSLRGNFIGRDYELERIDKILHGQIATGPKGVVIVTGMPGVGKTQLAIEYASRYGESYPGGIFWVDTEQGFSKTIIQLSDNAGINIDNTKEEGEQVKELWQKISHFPPVLIIVDYFPHDQSLGLWLPPFESISVLVTTRRKDLTRYSSIRIKPMTTEEGVKLINLNRDKPFGKEAEVLVEKLGGLPLALELARNYLILNPSITLESLENDMMMHWKIETLSNFSKSYEDELPSGHIKDVAAMFQISFDSAISKSAPPETEDLLHIMAFLAPTPVPKRLLIKILDNTHENDMEDSIENAISYLNNKLSLIELDLENDPLMHRLISDFGRITLDENNNLFVQIVEAVKNEMEQIENQDDFFISYKQLDKIAPHAECLLQFKEVNTASFISLSYYLGQYYKAKRKFRVAEKFYRNALLRSKNYLASEPQIIEKIKSNLAAVLIELKEIAGAISLLEEALESTQKNFKPGHPIIAEIQSNLASAFQSLGQLMKDERLFQKSKFLLLEALKSTQKNFGPGHSSIAKIQSKLAVVLALLGELSKAEKLLQESLKSNQKSLGPEHPLIAEIQSKLAFIFIKLGKLKEAEKLLQESLKLNKKIFGPEHLVVIEGQVDLANVLAKRGEPKEAKKLLQKSIKSLKKNFEPGHPVFTKIFYNLVDVLSQLGEIEELGLF